MLPYERTGTRHCHSKHSFHIQTVALADRARGRDGRSSLETTFQSRCRDLVRERTGLKRFLAQFHITMDGLSSKEDVAATFLLSA